MRISVKNIAAVYVLGLMLLKALSLPLVCLQFSLNKEFIASTLCENLDKPDLQCHGQCHLTKQMAKTGELPDTHQEKNGTKLAVADYFEDTELLAFKPIHESQSSFNEYYSYHLPAGYNGNIFHPPIV